MEGIVPDEDTRKAPIRASGIFRSDDPVYPRLVCECYRLKGQFFDVLRPAATVSPHK